jgi:hypothetical protein
LIFHRLFLFFLRDLAPGTDSVPALEGLSQKLPVIVDQFRFFASFYFKKSLAGPGQRPGRVAYTG